MKLPALRQGAATAAAITATLALAASGITGLTAVAGMSRAAAQTSEVGAGFWHTSGNQILDSGGNPVRIAGINWYGFETPDEIAHGLWAQDYHTIINDIKSLGYNTIRIPFCEGISENPDSSAASGYDATWWGGDLAEAGQYPVVLSSPGHVVYSAHDYGPDLFQQTWFNSSTTPASLDAVWNQFWGYLYADDTAPVWVGEFGTDNSSADIESTTPGSQGQWFESLVAYLAANPSMGWTYWALNGEDSYDLLDSNYDPTPVSALKQSLLATIQFPLPGAQNGTPPPTGTAAPVSCSAGYSLTNSWSDGFQAQIAVTNTGTDAISPWTLTFTFGGDQQIASLWDASYTQSGEAVTVTPESYDATIAAGSSVTVGFTGSFTSSDAAPAAFDVNGSACST